MVFAQKTGIDFAYFSLESDVVFEGSIVVYERIYCFNSKWIEKKEENVSSKWIWTNFFFYWSCNLTNNNIISY